MAVFGGDKLVDTLCCPYCKLVPMQTLLDAGVDPMIFEPHTRCWMGNGKVHISHSI